MEYQNTIQKMTERLDLGRSWPPFGRGVGQSGPPFGRSWPFFGRSISNFFETLVQDGLRKAFGIDFGWILGWLGRLLGRFGPGFGRTYEFFKRDRTESLITDAQFMHESFYWGISAS